MAWVSSNESLGLTDQQNNASLVWGFFSEYGWTLNAVCGMLGNMVAESTINPGRWESGIVNPARNGLGLVQWTPGNKLITWCQSQGYNYTDGTAQCLRIIYELRNGIQYYATSDYPLDFWAFTSSTENPHYLASAFLHNYERPEDASATEQYRRNQAQYWWDYFEGGPVPPPPDPPGPAPGGGGGMLPFIFWGRKHFIT